jgi:hypothetical protein
VPLSSEILARSLSYQSIDRIDLTRLRRHIGTEVRKPPSMRATYLQWLLINTVPIAAFLVRSRICNRLTPTLETIAPTNEKWSLCLYSFSYQTLDLDPWTRHVSIQSEREAAPLTYDTFYMAFQFYNKSRSYQPMNRILTSAYLELLNR